MRERSVSKPLFISIVATSCSSSERRGMGEGVGVGDGDALRDNDFWGFMFFAMRENARYAIAAIIRRPTRIKIMVALLLFFCSCTGDDSPVNDCGCGCICCGC